MSSPAEMIIIAALVIAAAAFIILRIIKTARGKQRSCCSGSDAAGRAKTCPHCSRCGTEG